MENDKVSFRSQGGQLQGRLVRGFVYDSKLKSNISSIPAKFETVVYKTHSQKGFLTSSGRFDEMKPTAEVPGPGTYCKQDLEMSFNSKASTSYSQKGYGNGFLSKTIRGSFERRYINSGPGPGSYSSIEKDQKNSTNTSSFKTPMRQTLEQLKEKSNSPGPCTYNKIDPKRKGNTYHSAFISQSNRQKYLSSSTNPPPGTYNLAKGFVYKNKSNYPAFAEPYEKKKDKLQLKELVNIVEGEVYEQNPGPGDYNPKIYEPHIQTVNDHFFIKSEKNRFGDWEDEERQKKILKFPGPGTYNSSFVEEEKDLIRGSVFVSKSKRVPFGDFEKKLGPNPKMLLKAAHKKSFHMNLTKTWV